MTVDMSPRLVVASLFLAGTAYAQAPEDAEPAESAAPVVQPAQAVQAAPTIVVAAPGMVAVTPVAVAPVAVSAVATRCGDCIAVMENRWSVGLSLGSMGLAAKSTPDASTSFAVGELAIRFRATPHLELELAVGGGRQHDNGVDGDLEVNTGAIALRYRFMPYRKWNVYALAGIGGASVVSHEATDQERHDATRPMFELGVGVERRFAHFALAAELRGVSLGDTKAESDAMSGGVMTDASTTTPPPATTTSSDKMSGGQFTFGASYYF
jgi:opacity protein-like surface antigen